MQNSGTWTVENGLKVWRLAVRVRGTLSWSFYLSRFVVPEGGELYVWNEDRTHYLGAFNHLNVKSWEGLALSLIEGTERSLNTANHLGWKLVAKLLLVKWCKAIARFFAEKQNW